MEDILKNLSEDQALIAVEVARKAKQMGINPRLAVALAYRESGFNPQAKGSKGEIGLMQVMPQTAESMGFSVDDLKDPSKNIEIGLTYLKRGLDKFGGDPVLAAAGYNAGLDHPYFRDPEKSDLPQSTKEYLRGISNYGGFSSPEPEQAPERAPEAAPEVSPASEEDFQAKKAQIALDLMGAGAGAGAAKVLDVGKNVAETGRAIRALPQALQAAAMPPAATGVPAAPAGAMPPRPIAGGPAGPVGGPASPLKQMGGPGAFNYGKAFGLTDIEAGRALDMSKNPGGASDLIRQRAEGLQRVQQMGGGFAENPRFGGLMTPEPSAGGGPRASFVQGPGGLSQIPTGQPIPNTPVPPKGPGALSRIAEGAKGVAGAIAGSPLVRGALGGLSIAEQGTDAYRRAAQGDTVGAAVAGLGAAGGGMMMVPNPVVAGVGAAISAASPLTLYLRDKIRNQPEMPPPSERELFEASRPAFVYPSP